MHVIIEHDNSTVSERQKLSTVYQVQNKENCMKSQIKAVNSYY